VDCLQFQAHPITTQVTRSTEAVISVGASLEIRPPARPVVVGRYGFSDLGNAVNERGAYLGDYQYQVGEQVGDVVLAAGGEVGSW
jgi:hypothetical protein